MSDPKKEDILDLLRAERVKLEATVEAKDQRISDLEKALAAKADAPPAPAAASPAPAPAPAPPPPPPPTSAIAFVGLPIAEQERLKKAEPGIFDRLLRQTGRVHVSDGPTYLAGEIIRGRDVHPPSTINPAPQNGARKPAPSSAKR